MITSRFQHNVRQIFVCIRCEVPRPKKARGFHVAAPVLQRSWRDKQRFSIFELSRNRLWTKVAGFDPKVTRENEDLWKRFRSIAAQEYLRLDFDLSTPWNSQEPAKKSKVYRVIASNVSADENLKAYPGLQEHDLIAWRLSIFHQNQRRYLNQIVKENKDGKHGPFIPEIIEAMRKGEIRLLSIPHSHQMETLREQRARIALSVSEKRQESNEAYWREKRLSFKDEPHDPEVDRLELAQATSARSEAQRKRWQRWREKLRSGEIPPLTRLHTEESRQRQSQVMKERLAKVEWTPEMREMKRRVGALGLEKQRQLKAAQRS